MDRSGSLSAEHHSSVCAAGSAEEQLFLRIARRHAGDSVSDASDRRAVFAMAVPCNGLKLALIPGMNRRRVQRLMQLMGIEAIGPKRRTAHRSAGHEV